MNISLTFSVEIVLSFYRSVLKKYAIEKLVLHVHCVRVIPQFAYQSNSLDLYIQAHFRLDFLMEASNMTLLKLLPWEQSDLCPNYFQ